MTNLITPVSTTELTWEWKRPLPEAKTASAPIWLKEIWELRGRVFAEGGRAGFLRADGSYADEDTVDFYCYHLMVRLDGQLIGCLRSLPLLAPQPGLVETLIGAEQVEQILQGLGVNRALTLEAGRWVVAREQAHRLLGKNVVAASWVMARNLGYTMVICATGTRDNQAVMAQRLGSRPIPGFDLIPSEVFNDQLMLLYTDLTNPSEKMLPLLEKMEQLLISESA
jgi:N-acyl-L-homoserine lactone synthetase